jgi:hypothetical protein
MLALFDLLEGFRHFRPLPVFRFLFNQIDPGIYTITVQQRGFKTVVQKNIQLHSRGVVTADITLEVSDMRPSWCACALAGKASRVSPVDGQGSPPRGCPRGRGRTHLIAAEGLPARARAHPSENRCNSHSQASLSNARPAKPRVIVTSDFPPMDVIPIGASYGPLEKRSDPDDVQSMVRLLLYGNDLEIEGLVASAGPLADIAKSKTSST